MGEINSKTWLEEQQAISIQEQDTTIKQQNEIIDQMKSLLDSDSSTTPQEQNDIDKYIEDSFSQQYDRIIVQSKTYLGRKVVLSESENKVLHFKQYSHHMAESKERQHGWITFDISPETFVLMVETLNYACDVLQIDKESIIDKLTAGIEQNKLEFITRVVTEQSN